jgi:hypothetical protein
MKHTIEYKGFDFEYRLYHQPEERQTLEDPGCPEYFEVTNITLMGKCAYELLGDQIDEFEEYVINSHTNDKE